MSAQYNTTDGRWPRLSASLAPHKPVCHLAIMRIRYWPTPALRSFWKATSKISTVQPRAMKGGGSFISTCVRTHVTRKFISAQTRLNGKHGE